MNQTGQRYDVIIVGGGPVGLFLACRLTQLGLPFVVLEKRHESLKHSRSIGIHPPGLECLQTIGIADEIIEKGVQIKRGLAFDRDRLLGELSFEACPKPFNFILTLPQYETEAVLETRLCQLVPQALRRGAEVVDVETTEEGVRLTYQQGGCTQQLCSRFLVACDGKDSTVREKLHIPFRGRVYGDTYVMGDFKDNTNLGMDAAIYLCAEGLVESFPLPNQVRRWVVKTDQYLRHAAADHLARLVAQRIGHRLPLATNSMLSAFGVQRFVAQRFVQDGVILVGDAAHVVSPIGGQGMNLGWLDAASLVGALDLVFNHNCDPQEILESFNQKRQKAARTAIKRAAFNMMMGRKTKFQGFKLLDISDATESPGGIGSKISLQVVRNTFVRTLSHTPMKHVLARMFTMRGLQ